MAADVPFPQPRLDALTPKGQRRPAFYPRQPSGTTTEPYPGGLIAVERLAVRRRLARLRFNSLRPMPQAKRPDGRARSNPQARPTLGVRPTRRRLHRFTCGERDYECF